MKNVYTALKSLVYCTESETKSELKKLFLSEHK